MPGPSKWNRKAKARNDRRAAARSGGGRTASEAAFGRSQRAAGRAVSRTNLGAPRPPSAERAPRGARAWSKAKKNLLTDPDVVESVQRLRERYATPTAQTQEGRRRETKLENTAIREAGITETPQRTDAFLRSQGKALTGGAARAERGMREVRESTELNPDEKTVKRYRGQRVVGTIASGDVRRAAKRRELRRSPDGLTTPTVRRTQRKVKRAKRQLRKAKAAARSGIEGPLTPGQKKFAEELARITAVNPRVAGAWALSEMSNNFATAREAEGNHNWLNIGYFDSGPDPAITNDPVWRNPKSAAKATAQFLRGQKFGAGANIPSILPRSRGASDEEQIRAISESGWASSSYEKGASLRGTREMIGFTPPKPGAKRRLDRARAKAETIDEEAARLGLPGTRGLSKEGKRDIEENYRIRKEKGEWAGSQALIQKILKAGPNLASDKEARGTGSYHDTSNLTAYAQDIPISGGLEQGEPVYDQALLDRVTKRIRRMGGEVPDLKMGMGYTNGYLQGYTLEIIPDSTSNWHGTGPHLHIGAKWTGEKPPPGTQLGGSDTATGSVGPGGTSFPSSSPSAPGGPVTREQRRKSVLRQLRDLGYSVTSEGIRRTGLAAGSTVEAPESVSTVKRRYGIK